MPPTSTPTNAPATNTPTPTNSLAPGTATPTGGPTLTPTRVGIPSTGDTWYWTHHEAQARVEKIGDVVQTNQTVVASNRWGGAGDAVFVAVNHKGASSNGLWVSTAYQTDDLSWGTMMEKNGQSWNDYTSFVTYNVAINYDEVVRQAALMGYSRIDHFLSRVPEYGALWQATWAAGADNPPWGPTNGYAEIISYDVLHYTNQSNTECKPWGELKTFDLTKVGNLVGGSYTSFPTPDGNIQIDASISYELPSAVYGQYGYTTAGLLWDITPNAQSNLPSPAYITFNNSVYVGDALVSSGVLPGISVAIAPGTKTVNLHFSQHLPEYLAPSVLNKLLLTVTLQSPFGQGLLNCDGDMEILKRYTPWLSLQPEKEVGRLNTEDLTVEITESGPACGYGRHVVGMHPAIGINRQEAGTAYEYFTVPYAGMMYYKFRYKSAGLFGLFASSPNVYIAPKNTGISTDILGLPGLFDQKYVKSDWTLVRGAIEMEAGNYGLYLDSTNKSWPVYYDDVYFSTVPFGEECTNEKVQDIPATPGPTTTDEAATPFPSPNTPSPTVEIPNNSPTPNGTPINTVTPRPSAVGTIRPSATSGPGQPNPTQNTTPNGEGTPSGPPNPDMPPEGPGDTIGFSGDGAVDCIRPTNWFSIGWWIDYSRCSVISFISFGPSQQATAVAIPGQFMRFEPFGTVKEFSDGVAGVRTEVASYKWNESGSAAGVKDSIDPVHPIIGASCSDPWNGNLNLGNCNSNIINNEQFVSGCSSKISNLLPGALAQGMCTVFGVTRNIGLLPWMQFFINLLALIMPLRTAFTIIGMRNTVSSTIEEISDYQDRSTAKNA